jgi:hypothetical protein
MKKCNNSGIPMKKKGYNMQLIGAACAGGGGKSESAERNRLVESACRSLRDCCGRVCHARFYREHRSTLLAGIGSLGKDELDVSQQHEFHIFCCNG